MITIDPSIEKSIKDLGDSLDSIETSVLVCNLVLLVGLVVEYWHDVKELFTKSPFDWRLFQTLLGGVLITLGVGGELWFGYRASTVSEQLRQENHRVTADLNLQADKAQLDAAVANKSARELKVQAEGLAGENIKLQGQFEKATAEANVKQEELKQQNLDTQKKA